MSGTPRSGGPCPCRLEGAAGSELGGGAGTTDLRSERDRGTIARWALQPPRKEEAQLGGPHDRQGQHGCDPDIAGADGGGGSWKRAQQTARLTRWVRTHYLSSPPGPLQPSCSGLQTPRRMLPSR